MAKISIKYIVYNKYRQVDGRYPIKLRITYKRIPAIVSTNKFACEEDLCAVKKGDESKARTIKDTTLRRRVEDLIRKYEDAAANFDPYLFPDWTVTDVIKYLNKFVNKECFRLDFPSYCDKFCEKKKSISNSKRSYRNYINAKQALCSFMEREHFDISLITSARLREFETYLVNTYGVGARAVSMYASGIATMHKAAQAEYNSEEIEEMLIKNPYAYYSPPKQVASSHRDVERCVVQKMINDYQSLRGRERVGVGAFLLSFATMGMNMPDLYDCEMLGKDRIHYFRQKTRDRRKDRAEMVVQIPQCIIPLIMEYSDKSKPRKKAFNFYIRYNSFANLNDAAEKGIREYRTKNKLPSQLTPYSARHTWATIARSSKCKISSTLIDECLDHTTPASLVDTYAKKDFSVYWDANKKVLNTLNWEPLQKK